MSAIRARFDTKRKTHPAGEGVFVVQPAGAGQAAVTVGNADGEVGGLTISDPPTQVEVLPPSRSLPLTFDGTQAIFPSTFDVRKFYAKA